MTTEIKTTSGQVLYTAETATDVRAALTEAVLGGANLGDADLYGADLRGADLRGADLRGADLYDADLYDADLYGADLRGANLRGADLRGADLGDANLYGANLYDANLYDANLRGANLRGADLRGADLYDATGLNPLITTPLHILSDQPGNIRAYKLVNADGTGPVYGTVTYRVGETVSVTDADEDPAVQCGAGINVATLDWCLSQYQVGQRVLVVEFTAADIAAIPHGSDGKFRVRRVTVVGEKTLAELGLEPAAEASSDGNEVSDGEAVS